MRNITHPLLCGFERQLTRLSDIKVPSRAEKTPRPFGIFLSRHGPFHQHLDESPIHVVINVV